VTLVSTDWLKENLNKVKILDASWHMPNTGRDAYKEFQECHIEEAQFFDLDKNSDEESLLPHMLPDKEKWRKIISNFGIKNSDQVIVYDNSDVMSSCRCWYMLIYFGHDPKKVSVLNGGLKKWKIEKRKTTSHISKFANSEYNVDEKKFMVKNKNQIDTNIETPVFELIDARGKNRFLGLELEPRLGLKSGCVKNSKNIPFTECVNKGDRTFKSKEELLKIFKRANTLNEKNQVFTCGSGITACILALANKIISDKNPTIYDGSWAEYGSY
jgi:thiosulfate/3-mercaptopyruvate sulfurtransferase